MELLFVPPLLRRLDEVPIEALLCGVFAGERPPRGVAGLVNWRLAGRVDRLVESGFLTGDLGEVMLLPGRPSVAADKVLLFGLGPRETFDEGVFDAVVRRQLRALVDLCARSAVVELPGRHDDALSPESSADRFLAAAAEHDGAFDAFTLVERPQAQRRVTQHMIEQRRRVRRL